jgi:hypothetical protein
VHELFTEKVLDTIADVRDIEKLCVPSSDNVWIYHTPLVKKLDEQVILISTQAIVYILTAVLKLMKTPDNNFLVLVVLHCD